MSGINTDAMQIAETVLRKHHIPDENTSFRMGERPKVIIEAIIRDIQAANAEASE